MNREDIIRMTIKTKSLVAVERIVADCSILKCGYHEDIADTLFARLGGEQTLTAHHHGVDIETVRKD